MTGNWSRTSARRSALGLLAAAGLLLAGCGTFGGDLDEGNGQRSAEFDALDIDATALGGDELQEHIVRRFEAFWTVFDDAAGGPTSQPEQDVPDLADFADGNQLALAHAQLRELALADQSLMEPEPGPDRPAPVITSDHEYLVRVEFIHAGLARLAICHYDDNVLIGSDGTVVDDAVETRLLAATMNETIDGRWKVTEIEVLEVASGDGRCRAQGAEFPW